MDRNELVKRILERLPDVYPKDADDATRMIIKHMSETLEANGRVEVRGFGAFSVTHRLPRKGRNPRTGEEVSTEDKYVPHFKPGKDLRDRVNAGAKKRNPYL